MKPEYIEIKNVVSFMNIDSHNSYYMLISIQIKNNLEYIKKEKVDITNVEYIKECIILCEEYMKETYNNPDDWLYYYNNNNNPTVTKFTNKYELVLPETTIINYILLPMSVEAELFLALQNSN